MISHSFCFLALVAFSRVSAHGYVKLIKTGGKEYLPYRPYESGGNTNTVGTSLIALTLAHIDSDHSSVLFQLAYFG